MTINTQLIIFKNNDKNFFKNIVSINNLLIAWIQLKNNPELLMFSDNLKILGKINYKWFTFINKIFLKEYFQYFDKFKISELQLSLIFSFQIKIIEKVLLNTIKLSFEGLSKWYIINQKKIKKLDKKELIKKNNYKYNEKGWFQNTWIINPICNIYFKQSIHLVLEKIKKWPQNINWFLNFQIEIFFDKIQLRNIFLKYFNQFKIWTLVESLIKINFSPLIVKKKLNNNNLKIFLWNIYMLKFDYFLSKLAKLSNSFFFHNRYLNLVKIKKYKKLKSEFNFDECFNILKKYKNTQILKNGAGIRLFLNFTKLYVLVHSH